MIRTLLRELAPKLWIVALAGALFFANDPAFHAHEAVEPELAAELGPLGLAAPASYLAGFAMIVLLADFVAADRRRGYAQILFAHRTSPLGYYARRWALAYVIAMVFAAVFLFLSQGIGWGEVRGGWSGLLLPAVNALVFGGLMAFLSAVLRRGDAWVGVALFLPTLVPQILQLLQMLLPGGVMTFLFFVLPPQTTAMQALYLGLVESGRVVWSAAAFAAGYGVVWLAVAALVLRLREWR